MLIHLINTLKLFYNAVKCHTLEKDYSVIGTVRLVALNCSIQMVWNTREYLRDGFWKAIFQLVIFIAENLVILHRRAQNI